MCTQQSGFVLLLMLFVLLGAGVTGLSQTQGYRTVTASGFMADQYALQTARQALLTYAALYPWLYGPRGAGPGHLPCPDTDTLSSSPLSPSSSRDGPNPPCGSGAHATGQLPRHVNFPGHRYVFHVEPYQRLEYHVSSDLINNPVNRIVNDTVIRGEQGQWPVVAWVRQPLDEAGQSRASISQIPVSREALLPGVRQSVAAWLVQQVNRKLGKTCSPIPERMSASTSLDAAYLLSLIAQRESDPVTQSAPQPVDLPASCMESPPQDMSIDDRLIEGVPLAAHWFIRNGWHERVVIRLSEGCAAALSGVCLLVPDPSGSRPDRSDERLYFTWQVAS